MTAFWFISPAMCIIIRFYLQRENRCRERLLAEKETDSEGDEAIDTGSEIVKIGERIWTRLTGIISSLFTLCEIALN